MAGEGTLWDGTFAIVSYYNKIQLMYSWLCHVCERKYLQNIFHV